MIGRQRVESAELYCADPSGRSLLDSHPQVDGRMLLLPFFAGFKDPLLVDSLGRGSRRLDDLLVDDARIVVTLGLVYANDSAQICLPCVRIEVLPCREGPPARVGGQNLALQLALRHLLRAFDAQAPDFGYVGRDGCPGCAAQRPNERGPQPSAPQLGSSRQLHQRPAASERRASSAAVARESSCTSSSSARCWMRYVQL